MVKHSSQLDELDYDSAIELLRDPSEETPLGPLMQAMAIVCESPRSSIEDLLLGLQHPGVIRETAAIALHGRSGRPSRAGAIIVDLDDWRNWLGLHGG